MDVLTTAFVPGSTAISGVSFTHDLIYDTPAADLIALKRRKMLAISASDAQAQTLLDNGWCSLSVLTALVTDLEQRGGVTGRPEVLTLAATAAKEEARFLASGPRAGSPRRQRGAGPTGHWPLVSFIPDGWVVVPAPVD